MKAKIRVSKAARENAFFDLLSMIKDGTEFLVAHDKVCLKYQLSVEAGEALTEQYDNYCKDGK